MKKISFALLIGIMFFSCKQNKEKALEDHITIRNSYWTLKAIDQNKVKYLGQNFVFKRDKTYSSYQSFTEKKIGAESFDLHLENRKEWKIDDDTFYLKGTDPEFKYGIIRFNKDTVWLKNDYYHFILTKHLLK